MRRGLVPQGLCRGSPPPSKGTDLTGTVARQGGVYAAVLPMPDGYNTVMGNVSTAVTFCLIGCKHGLLYAHCMLNRRADNTAAYDGLLTCQLAASLQLCRKSVVSPTLISRRVVFESRAPSRAHAPCCSCSQHVRLRCTDTVYSAVKKTSRGSVDSILLLTVCHRLALNSWDLWVGAGRKSTSLNETVHVANKLSSCLFRSCAQAKRSDNTR